MQTRDLKVTDGASAGAWIEPGLARAAANAPVLRANRAATGPEKRAMSGTRTRIAYVTMAVVAFVLSLAAGDTLFIAVTSTGLVVSLLGAFIATKQERQEG